MFRADRLPTHVSYPRRKHPKDRASYLVGDQSSLRVSLLPRGEVLEVEQQRPKGEPGDKVRLSPANARWLRDVLDAALGRGTDE